MRLITILTIGLLVLTGCNKNSDKKLSATPPPRAPDKMADKMEFDLKGLQSAGNPADVMVEVNGTKLTRGETDEETRYRLSGMMSQIPPNQMEEAKAYVQKSVIEQFVVKTLMLQEADRRKIEVTKTDEEEAYKEIRTQLPAGVTLEDIMKNSPRGEKAMREEVLIGIKVKRLMGGIATNAVEVTDKEVEEFIEQNKENLSMPENVRARHILVQLAPTDDEKAKADKKAKAEAIRKKLVDGADFAETARESSDCPSKQKGGDLGTFTREKMVPAFSEAAYAQQVNAIGPVVETQFGYHIIQVTEHNQAGMMPREKITEIVKNQKRQKSMIEFVDELKNAAKITYSKELENTAPPAMMRPASVTTKPVAVPSKSAPK